MNKFLPLICKITSIIFALNLLPMLMTWSNTTKRISDITFILYIICAILIGEKNEKRKREKFSRTLV